LINAQLEQSLHQKFLSFWLPVLSILLLVVFFLILNIPIIKTLWRYSFDDGTYSHAYLIPVIVVYLYYYLAKQGLLVFRAQISWPAIVILAISCYVLVISVTTQISFAYWLASLLVLCASFNVIFQSNLRTIFPLCYFIFLMPFWGVLTTPLQNISVFVVNFIMNMTTVPVYVEQQFVHIPAGIFEIADGCSGLRYLIISLAISSLYAFLYLRSIKNIVLFTGVAILGALITNWLRISALIIIGHNTDMTSSLMTDHNMFGWYLYIPFMFLLFKFGNTLTDEQVEESSTVNTTPSDNASKPNLKIVSLVLIFLIFSSTGLRATYSEQYSTDQVANNTATDQYAADKLSIFPKIIYYTWLEKVTANEKEIYLIYHFSPVDLDEKPSFFENNLIPKGWKILKRELNSTQQILHLQKDNQLAMLVISYQIADIKKPTVKAFKIERIKQAFLGAQPIKLHWRFSYTPNKLNN
jgi:exosortase A